MIHYQGTRVFDADVPDAYEEQDLCPRCKHNFKGIRSRLCQPCHMSGVRRAYCDERDVRARARARMAWCIEHHGDPSLSVRYRAWLAEQRNDDN